MANAHETSPATCATCGSAIVETVNGGTFHDGECGPCEYRGYRTNASLLDACERADSVLCDLSYHDCFRGKSKRFREANEVISALAAVLNDAHEPTT
jgi:hypothetical protein